MKFGAENTPDLSMSRPVWMSQEGGPLYNSWANEVLTTAEDPALWNTHLHNVETRTPGVQNGVVLDPDYTFRPLFHKERGLIQIADENAGTSERLLIPRMDEILHYTSAKVFMKKDLSEEQAVAVHARDSLRFAMAIAIGLAHDVFTERTQSARNMLNGLFSIHQADTTQASLSATCHAIREIVGPLWDTSLEESAMEHDPWVLQRVFDLQTLAFIKRALDNATFQRCLEDFSVTAFDVLGDRATTLGSKKLRADETNAQTVVIQPEAYGWQYRGYLFGFLKRSHASNPKAVLLYNPQPDVFEVRPETITFLRGALRRQNNEGLHPSARTSAGNIQELEKPLSVGCPVHNMSSIGRAATFAALVFSRMIDYHREQATTA